jgi:hypothetical protein
MNILIGFLVMIALAAGVAHQIQRLVYLCKGDKEKFLNGDF